MVAVRRQIWEAGTVVVIPFVAAVTGGLLPLLPSRPPASPIPAYQIWERDGRGGGKPAPLLPLLPPRAPASLGCMSRRGGREGGRRCSLSSVCTSATCGSTAALCPSRLGIHGTRAPVPPVVVAAVVVVFVANAEGRRRGERWGEEEEGVKTRVVGVGLGGGRCEIFI